VVSNVKGEVWVLNTHGNIQYLEESNINLSDPWFPVSSYAFNNPNSMAVDEVTGEIWIGDNGNHQVVKVLSPDSLAVVISGVDFIADIVVNR
jgi:glucose/arabinose dehydrogenase